MEARAVPSGGKLIYWLPFVAALGLIAILYRETFLWWWGEWTYPGSFYAHAVFVPFFVAVMAWRNRERLQAANWKPSWIGLPLIGLAMLMLLFAQRSDISVIKSISFVFLMIGTALMLLGTRWTRTLLFPLFFLIMMMPLIPDQLINGIAFPIQMASASFATKMLNLFQLHASQQGTVIQMESYRMSVELPCSGFKTLISLLTFSAAFAYLVEAATWKRWALFLTTIPLSLIINALRITLIGIVGEIISSDAATTFHDYSGFIVLILAFIFLFNFARILQCDRFLGVPLSDKAEKEDDERAKAEEELRKQLEAEGQTVRVRNAEAPWWKELFALRPAAFQMRQVQPFVLALCLIFAGVLAVRGSVFQPVKPGNPIATTQVPLQFTTGDVTWTAETSAKDFDKLQKDVQEVLHPSRVINRLYRSSKGGQIQLFITAGNGRKTFHDPHTCALGSNAQVVDIKTIDVPTKYGTVRVQQSHYKYTDSPSEQLLMFFYVVEDKVLQKTSEIRNAMIMQTFLGDSGIPSYFVRVTQALPGTDESRIAETTKFIEGLWANIGGVMQGKEKAIPEAPPTPLNETLLPAR
jgi:exosortase